MRMITTLVFTTWATSLLAQDIGNREDLIDYLQEKMPNGQSVNTEYRVGGGFAAGHRFGDCMSEQTFSRIDPVTRILVYNGDISVKVTKEVRGLMAPGMGAACHYEVTGISQRRLKAFGATFSEEAGRITGVSIPLMKQTLLGVTDVQLQGTISVNGERCDVAFIPYFKNSDPSLFAQRHRSELEEIHRWKNVFSDEYKTRMWCLTRKPDGSWNWLTWARL